MEKECKNNVCSIYYSCRKEAAKHNDKLNSREGASELLNVSESSLRNYELLLTPVPVDVVVKMADLYKSPEIEASYCKHDCPIGKRMNIQTQIRDISQITCSLLDHADADRMHKIKKALLCIASDGKISEEEEMVLKEIVYDLGKVADDVMELKMYLKKYGGAEDGSD